MIPYREFKSLLTRTLKAHDPDSHNYSAAADWDTVERHYGQFGEECITPGSNFKYWVQICRSMDPDFEDKDGLDQIATARLRSVVSMVENNGIVTFSPMINVNQEGWTEKVVGRFYDGVNQWTSYGANTQAPPKPGSLRSTYFIDTPVAGITVEEWDWWLAGYWGATYVSNGAKSDFYANGFGAYMFTAGYDAALLAGEKIRLNLEPQWIRLYYYNPIVNSLSRYVVPEAGGIELKLYGIAFDQSDAELAAPGGGVAPAGGGFKSWVRRIQFIGLQGQGTTEVLDGIGFTRDSDSEITIAAMPALARGTYEIRLSKTLNGLAEFWGYAGDWRSDSNCKASEGSRIILRAGNYSEEELPKRYVFLTDWNFKDPLGNIITKRYAEIDVRSSAYFWEGRILSMSGLKRSVDDLSGMYSISDMQIELANDDLEFSKLLSQYVLKNQIVGVYYMRGDEPAENRSEILRLIVDDHDLDGNVLRVSLRDITKKFFDKDLPRLMLTEEEYPDMAEGIAGKYAPEILGINELADLEIPGAIEAYLIDTVNHKYIAAGGSCARIPKVYSDGILQNLGADYAIVYEAGGRTIIDFTSSQGDNKVTFDADGYVYGDWQLNSGDICVVNPAYVLAFVLAFLLEIPIDFLDLDSYAELAQEFEDLGEGDSGRVIIQDRQEPMAILKEMLFTYGVKMFPGVDGRLRLKRKDIEDYSTALTVFEQFDSMGPGSRKFGLNAIVNFARAKYDFFPTASMHKGSLEEQVDPSVALFDVQIESDSPLEMKWTSSGSLISSRLSEILNQRAYGYKKLEIEIPVDWLDYFDIFTNFKYQTEFGLAADGSGERGRLYYILSISINWHRKTISIEAADLQWMVGQWFILGDRAALPAAWSAASPEQRIYGYLADRADGKFTTGEAGKKLRDRNK